MKNAKASKLVLASPRRRGDSQIIARGQLGTRSSPRCAPSPVSASHDDIPRERDNLPRERDAIPRGRDAIPRGRDGMLRELELTVRGLERRRLELESENAELRSAGSQLSGALERYTELFGFAPCASVDVSFDGRVRELNRAASQLLGVSAAELCGRPLCSIVAPDDRARFDAFFAERLSNERGANRAPHSAEFSLLRSEFLPLRSEFLPLRGEFLPLRGESSRFDAQLVATRLPRSEPSILIAFEDVTERNRRDASLARAQQALREADRRKDEFLALLSHELRNPLTPLANCLFVLSHSEPGSERAHAARSIMQRQVDLLTRLTEDLLEVTRIARGKMRLRCGRVDWCELLQHTLEDHRASFDTCGVSLDSHVGPGSHWVWADPARLTQAMSNLLGNALKFTPREGRVAVRLEREGERVALRVSDTGAGISPEVLPRVFEPFAQAPQTLDRSRGGLGLGLAVVKGLVELHGGAVSVSSAGLGLGTELAVWLPLDASDERPAHGALTA